MKHLYSKKNEQFFVEPDLPDDVQQVTESVYLHAIQAKNNGLDYVVVSDSEISVAPSPKHKWYADKNCWIDYEFAYSKSTGSCYLLTMLGDYADLPTDLQNITPDVKAQLDDALSRNLTFIIVADGTSIKVAPDQTYDYDVATAQFVVDPEKAAHFAEQQRIASIPSQVTMRQARQALLAANLLDKVTAAMQSEKVSPSIKIDWEYATEVSRTWVEKSGLVKLLNLSVQQLDDLFLAASRF